MILICLVTPEQNWKLAPLRSAERDLEIVYRIDRSGGSGCDSH
jgi:hypothetical protein